MASVDVLNWDKKKVGTVDLPSSVFEREVKKEILFEVVHWQRACKRSGNAVTKTKGLVAGGGKKPFKQKGTGNARQGSIRSPLMPGGGTAFGPQKRDYSYTLPKKVRRAGLSIALSHLLKEGKLFVVDAMESQGKSNALAKTLKTFGLKKAILIDQKADNLFGRACKNIPRFQYTSVAGLNVFDLLKYDCLVITKNSIESVVQRCEGSAQ